MFNAHGPVLMALHQGCLDIPALHMVNAYRSWVDLSLTQHGVCLTIVKALRYDLSVVSILNNPNNP